MSKHKCFIVYSSRLLIFSRTYSDTYGMNISVARLNVCRVGEAELAEIPEGYEPEHWEYYKVRPFVSLVVCGASFCHCFKLVLREGYAHGFYFEV